MVTEKDDEIVRIMTFKTVSVVLILSIILFTQGSDGETGKCPDGLRGHVEKRNCFCYQFSYPYQDLWSDGQRACQNRGGHLAEVLDKETNNFLTEVLNSKYRDASTIGFWLGATDSQTEGLWKWETSNKLLSYTRWAFDEPDEPAPAFFQQDCLYLKKEYSWKWASLQCSASNLNLPYICQYAIEGCTTSPSYAGLTQVELIGVVAGSVIGFLILVIFLCWACFSIRSACGRRTKRSQEQRAIRLYQRNPTTSVYRDSVYMPTTEPELPGTSAEPSDCVPLDHTMNLKVKDVELPTADSIAAEAEQRALVVDMTTGKQTIKRSNINRADDVSTRSLKSFKMDAMSQEAGPSDDEKVSLISSDDNHWNLDYNMANKHVDKNLAKSMGNVSDASNTDN